MPHSLRRADDVSVLLQVRFDVRQAIGAAVEHGALPVSSAACGRNGGNKGIVIHINNIENLSKDEEIEEAARTFRDLRDLFLAPYLHWLVVGTSDASFKLLGAYPQVRSVFLPSHPALKPLTIDEFMKLIHARYQHLMLKNRHLIPPVEDEAAARIYELFQGDLRGALRTLEQGCLALAGITEGDPVRPLRYDEIIRTLQPIYAAEMLAELSETMIQRMRSIAAIRKEGITQRQLQKLWGVTHQRVSQIVARLEQQGFLQQVGTRGRSKFYALTGAGAIALGIADA